MVPNVEHPPKGQNQDSEPAANAVRLGFLGPRSTFTEQAVLTQVAGDKSSTLVFPVPVDLLGSLLGNSAKSSSSQEP